MEDKEIKRLVVEILSLMLVLIIVVPICVHASENYQLKEQELLNIAKASIDISNKGDIKEVTVITGTDRDVKVNLLLKINKFSDEYFIFLDEEKYELNQLEYTEDEEHRYYNLGIYEVNDHRVFEFKIHPVDKVYYDEMLTYSFITEGVLW